MNEIKILEKVSLHDLENVIKGYSSDYKYEVIKKESIDTISFYLKLEKLPTQYCKKFNHVGKHLDLYADIVKQNTSFALYRNDAMIGLAICAVEEWNNTLNIWEFHIDKKHQHMGFGMKLMNKVIDTAKSRNLRAVTLETQNTNYPAIFFYRKVGFSIDGIDISYYSNDDITKEVALFMKYYIK